MYDLIDNLFGTYAVGKIARPSGLRANTEQQVTSSNDRLAALEHRYERMHVVTVALWALLKEHNGLTDSELQRFIAALEASEGEARGSAGTMTCPHCSRVIRKSATRCLWCGTPVTSGDAFQGT